MKTKTEAKHTPTPWAWERIYGRRKVFMPDDCKIVGADGQSIGVCMDAFGVEARFPEGVDAANAAFILRACNAHDDLVAALRDEHYALVLSNEGYKGPDVEGMLALHRETMHDCGVCRLIAKAEGK